MKGKQITLILIVIIFSGFVIYQFLTPAKTVNNNQPAIADTPLDTLNQGEFTILKSIDFQNIQIFAIVGEAELNHKTYVSLEEAMDNNMVKLIETGSVNQLSINNLSKSYIYIQAGDIVKGGKQDRTLQTDMIIAPLSENIPLNSFCVESGRWKSRGDEDVDNFTSCKSIVSSRAMLNAARVENSQGAVWDKVSEEQAEITENVSKYYNDSNYKSNDNVSATSYQLTLESDKLQEFVDEYKNVLTEVLGTENIVGLAYAINGEIYGVDIFNNSKVFADISNKMLNAFIVEAISEKQDDLEINKVDANQISELLAIHLNEESSHSNSNTLNSETRYTTQQFETFNRFETTDIAEENWLHISYIVGAESSNSESNIGYDTRRQ